jgi:serine protease inhibitor
MFRPHALLLLVALAFVPLCGGCQRQFPRGSSHHASYTPPDAFPAVTPQPAVTAANAFGFHLFHKLTGATADNVFISPTSLMLALAMTYNGAGGETKAAMAKTLQVSGISVTDLNQQLSELQESLQTGNRRVQVEIANSLWASQGFTFRPEFVKICDASYAARVQTLDFRSGRALKTINGWAKKSTHGLIPAIVTPEDLNQGDLLLMDAVYFKGKWSNEFEKYITRQADFTLLDGKRKSVQMMEREGDYLYTEDDRLQAIALPYGDGRMNMIVVLPREEQGLPALQDKTSDETWKQLMGKMTKREGTIGLPRFEIGYERYLNEALKALGMGVAFTPTGDFSLMGDDIMGLAFVKHKTLLRVTERNTEAAAIAPSSVVTAAPPPTAFDMRVNHPFLLGILDTKTGSVVFLGSVSDPQETRAGE